MVNHQGVGATRVDESRGEGVGHCILRGADFFTEGAVEELAIGAVDTQTSQIGSTIVRIVGIRHRVADEINPVEADVLSILEADEVRSHARADSRAESDGAAVRFKLDIVGGRRAGDGGEDGRLVIARGKFHHEGAVDAALAESEEALIQGCVVRGRAADIADAGHRAGATDELGPASIVERLVVSEEVGADRHGVVDPSEHFVIARRVLLGSADGDIDNQFFKRVFERFILGDF